MSRNDRQFSAEVETKAGAIRIVVNHDGAVVSCSFLDRSASGVIDGPAQIAARQLAEYFAGSRREFDLPLAFEGTDFQKRVWSALCDIPYGTTISYAELARRVDSPRGVRAVGQANGRNRIAIIVPCHRVIASNGSLAGYAAGSDRKQALLALEGLEFPPAAAGQASIWSVETKASDLPVAR